MSGMEQRGNLPAKAIIAAVGCNVLFGSAFPMIKIGYKAFGIGQDAFTQIFFAGIRFFLAGIMVFVFAAIKNKRIPAVKGNNIPNVLLLAGIYTFLQYALFYIGLSNTSGASGSIVNSSSAFIAVIFAHFVYKDDRINARKLMGTLIGFLGVLFATLANNTLGSFSFFGEGLIILAATCFVVGSSVNRRAMKLNDCFTVTAYNQLLGSVLLITVGAIGMNGTLKVTLGGMVVLLYLSFVSAAGFLIWSYLVSKYPLGKISVYNFVIPVSGSIFSSLMLGENIMRWQYLLALVLVCFGIITVTYNRRTN